MLRNRAERTAILRCGRGVGPKNTLRAWTNLAMKLWKNMRVVLCNPCLCIIRAQWITQDTRTETRTETMTETSKVAFALLGACRHKCYEPKGNGSSIA